MLFQLAMIVGLSCVLGFAFNASSPVGVKFGKPFVASVVSEIVVKPAESSGAVAQPALEVEPPMPPDLDETPVVAAVVEEISEPAVPPAQPEPSFAAPWPVAVPASPGSHHHAVQNPATPNQSSTASPANPSQTHWPESKALVAGGRAVLVDVRHKAMFDAGHIPGAISLPESSSQEEFSAFLSSQPREKIIIVYCSSTSCSQSARVANRLVNEFQWPDVRYMTGGYMEYQQMEHANPAQ